MKSTNLPVIYLSLLLASFAGIVAEVSFDHPIAIARDIAHGDAGGDADEEGGGGGGVVTEQEGTYVGGIFVSGSKGGKSRPSGGRSW
eukprot:CAMPEP_0181084696 /NCGR_PEP_ID=MMETSP1071-20121207/4829_1 /TAXON_ID=35127 /ORGANISM="Thalassiosira sp., Strain NH16" /LENGTH=86 /DNA_ID=CAMNT_0023166439 /DNA_START=40 /DNA_END=297 /DNA_ORIENTATION=-